MFKAVKAASVALTIGLGSLTAMSTAHADGMYFSFGQQGTAFGIKDYSRQRAPAWKRHNHARPMACSPREAVRKAQRMGLRNVRIIREDRRAIQVAGRSYRQRSKIAFARAPHCPVIRSL